MELRDFAILRIRAKEEYEKTLNAIDQVEAFFSKGPTGGQTLNTDVPLSGEHVKPPDRPKRRRRSGGLSGTAIKALAFTPKKFGRKELIEAMQKYFPDESGEITRDKMNGAVEKMIDEGLIVQTVIGQGKRLAVYEKQAKGDSNEDADSYGRKEMQAHLNL